MKEERTSWKSTYINKNEKNNEKDNGHGEYQ